MKKITLTSLALLPLAATVALFAGRPWSSGKPTPAPPAEHAAKDPIEEQELARPAAHMGTGGSVPSYVSKGFKQSAQFGRWRPDPTEFVVTNTTIDLNTEQKTVEQYGFSAAFDIDMVVGRKNLFYLLGYALDGQTVVQRWRMKPIAFQGQASYVMKKTELYRGASLDNVRTFEMDPGNRFLLIVHSTPQIISRLELAQPGFPVFPEYDSSVVPSLTSEVSILAPMQHVTLGRVWMMLSGGLGESTAFHDSDNDGLFESWQIFADYDSMRVAFPREDWTNDFIFHPTN